MRHLTIIFMAVVFTLGVAQAQDDESTFGAGAKKAADSVKGFFGGLFGGDESNRNNSSDFDPTQEYEATGAGNPGNRPRMIPAPAQPGAAASPTREQIRAIQVRLNTLGYDAGTPDGLMGARTRRAITSYQQRAGLSVNGVPSVSLLHHLTSNQSVAAPGVTPGGHATALTTGPIAAANDYEGALHNDDYFCKDMVDEFRVYGSIKNIFESGAGRLGSWMSGVSEGETTTAASSEAEVQKILDEAKLTAKRTNWMPLSIEQLYGDAIHDRRLTQAPEVISRKVKGRKARLYKSADELLDKLLAGIPEEHPYEFKLFLISDAGVSAEALPGGYLYLSTGALNKGMAELVLGHEIAHVTKRHTTRELQARLIDSVSTVDDLKSLMTEREPGQIIKRAKALEGRFLSYSRQQELQSDACAVRLVKGLPGVKMSREIDRFIAEIGSTQADEALNASQHPSYPERRERMLQAMTPE